MKILCKIFVFLMFYQLSLPASGQANSSPNSPAMLSEKVQRSKAKKEAKEKQKQEKIHAKEVKEYQKKHKPKRFGSG